MKSLLGMSALLVIFFIGCENSLLAPQEPAGTPVELTSEEIRKSKIVFENMQEWYAWHRKGVSLNVQGRYQEALYCFSKAMKAWPKNISSEQEKKSISQHRPESTDTILQKASIYMKIKEPKLALYYLEKFKKYFPYDRNCLENIEKAKAMMKK